MANKVQIIGTLVDYSVKEWQSKKGSSFNASISIKKADGTESMLEARFMSNTTAKNYASLMAAQSLVGKRVDVAGNLEENIFSPDGKSVITNQHIRGSFIRELRPNQVALPDSATFTVKGFVAEPLVESYSDNGLLESASILIGVPNWNGEDMSLIKLNVEKEKTPIINGIKQRYVKDSVVNLGGKIEVVTTVVRIETPNDFGLPTVEQKMSTSTNYFIESGTLIDQNMSPDALHNPETRNALIQARTARVEKAKQPRTSQPAQQAQTATPTFGMPVL